MSRLLLALACFASLAGCLADTPSDAATLATSDATPAMATSEVGLPETTGSFAILTMAPHPASACEGAGVTLSPTPSDGATVELELPPDTVEARLELTETGGATGGNGYLVCAYQDDALVARGEGAGALDLAFPAHGGPLRVVVAVQAAPNAAVNLDAQAEWVLGGVAVVTMATP